MGRRREPQLMGRWTLVPGGTELELWQGDLTRLEVDAIVNAANAVMLGGGGVDGAIHRAAGRRLVEACRKVRPDALGRRCPPGEARITPGFALPAAHVIHTVGPIYRRDPDPADTLARAHRSSLALAREHGLRSVAFPAISCGAYGYPHAEAAAVALGVLEEDGVLDGLERVLFVHFGEATLGAWLDEATRRWGPAPG